MQNITESLSGINATDQVYAYEGRFYKVRVLVVERPPGTPVLGINFLNISGSETDAQGQTLLTAAGEYRIAESSRHSIMPDGPEGPIDTQAVIEGLRQACVQRTHAAAVAQDQFDQIFPQPTV